MKSQRQDKHIDVLIAEVCKDSFFLGRLLSEFKKKHHMSDLELAEFIECKPQALKRLALCRRPNCYDNRFNEDINRISTYVKCSPQKLKALFQSKIAGYSL